MRGYGGFQRPHRGRGSGRGLYSLSTRPVQPSLKEMGSGAANPGLLPITTPGTPQALKSNASDVNGSTQQGLEVPRYMYKYKYASEKDKRKRKYTPGNDDDHMQQKAAPGEQYRGGAAMRVPPYKKTRFDDDAMPGIEPRSVPGDQYEEGASVNTEADKQRSTQEENEEALSDFSAIVSKLKFAFKAAEWTGAVKLLSPEHRAVFDALHEAVTQLSSDNFVPGLVLPILRQAEDIVAGFSKDSLYALSSDAETWKKFLAKFYEVDKDIHAIADMAPPKVITNPKGQGLKPGESSIPGSNVEKNIPDEGNEPMQAYSGEEQKAQAGGDPNRTDPITPATGSRQTSATANSLVSIKKLKAAAERTVREQGPEAIHGNARERANMGKGALDTYEFQGPYDYPIYPGGRPDDTLTMMGAWRTNGGNDSSLWYSKKTAKGANAKRNKYFKWSAKGGGRWRKMSKDEMVNVIQKGGQSDNRFYGTRTNMKFMEFQRKRDNSVRLAKAGNALTVNSNHGYGSHGRDKYAHANLIGQYSESDVPPAATINKGEGPAEGPKETTAEKPVSEPQPTSVLTAEDKDLIAQGHAYDMFKKEIENMGYIWDLAERGAHYQDFMKAKRAGGVRTVKEWTLKKFGRN